MKKRFAVMFAVLLCVLLLSFAFSPITVTSASENTEITAESTEAPRFLNMLNHNFVYNEDFETFEGLANGAILANLDHREGDYIAEEYIKGYIGDMYGVKVVDFGEIGENHKPGYVYITPMGFTRFEHTNATVNRNEDGTYTVLTDVVVSEHDGLPYETTAVSLFAPCERSAFGYILVYSEISSATVSY